MPSLTMPSPAVVATSRDLAEQARQVIRKRMAAGLDMSEAVRLTLLELVPVWRRQHGDEIADRARDLACDTLELLP